MKTIRYSILALQIYLIAINCMIATTAHATGTLPIQIIPDKQALLLELGKQVPAVAQEDSGLRVFSGDISGHEGDSSIQVGADEISSLHPGFGNWKVVFRFQIKPLATSKLYTFWARWRQGGDPNVCLQTFEIWAGADPAKLELRASVNLKPTGWEYAWLAAAAPVTLKPNDTFIEIRNRGAGHDAKVFDAFLLASPLSSLPATGTAEHPLVLLELGSSPALSIFNKDPQLKLRLGSAVAGQDAQSLVVEKDEVQFLHQGFGNWGANFKFELNPEIAPGQYRFFARYKSGGEVSQVKQDFIVKSGEKPGELTTRGNFSLTNPTPWEYQWLQAEGTVTVLPGDRWLEINNTGKADGAKVFDAFLLKLESPSGKTMNPSQARLRNKLLNMTKIIPSATKRLLVLDTHLDKNETLLRGLSSDTAKPNYQTMPITYLAGSEATIFAKSLNLPNHPTALITDDHFIILGILTQPKSEHDVVRFLAEPDKYGTMPVPIAVAQEPPKPLKGGLPAAWLVGGLQDGLGGLSTLGLDNESFISPNPDQPYLSMEMMGGKMKAWHISTPQADGSTDIEPITQHTYGWSRGTGYAHLYLHCEQDLQAFLHLKQSGIRTDVWLDGQPLPLVDDSNASAGSLHQIKALLHGITTEGLPATALPEKIQPPQVASMKLSSGWHSLLIKLVMQHDQGQRFYFSGMFTDSSGKPLDTIKTQLSDPNVDLALNKIAAKLRPVIFTSAQANLPSPGDPLKLQIDLRWHPIIEEDNLPFPLPRFKAKLRLRLVDYSGSAIAEREITGLFPGEVDVDFGKTGKPGYYAVYPSLHSPDGKLIMNYPADGFTVVSGNITQKQRLDKKKLWNNDYYALADGDKSFNQKNGYFAWLERMGIFKSYGSYPGFDSQYQDNWNEAQRRGIVLFADSSGDSNWLNENQTEGETFIGRAAKYTRFFKSTNEIDIRTESQWQALREPKHWVKRTRWEFEHAHKIRNDAHYVGGSLVRPGDNESAGQWFKQVLQLGLDQYQDAWDIHAYPQQSPRFGGAIGNSESEDDRGVLAAYASLGMKNKLPFWLGETGAKAMHGSTGRRWQAEQVAKMIAWANSRSDYLGLAFCLGHEYDMAYGRLWDYSLGHKPGEAALYTASALIDGLPYQAFNTKDSNIQAAYFGETFMIWRSDQTVGNFRLKVDPYHSWVLVDVVGKVQKLEADSSEYADIPISNSPVYVLTQAEYERLTK